MTRPELRPLTSIRGLFAWAVVLFHVRAACFDWLPGWAMAIAGKGYLAVDFFFLLSGFVIWLNYGERLGQRGNAMDFLVRRLARIWPLHAAMLAFAALLGALLLETGRRDPHFPLALLPLHLLLIQDWGITNPLMWNDPAWSISAEWAAYLLIPVAAILLPRRSALSTPALLTAAIVPLLVLHDAWALFGMRELGSDIQHSGVLRCLTEFSCGTVLADLWRRWRGNERIERAAWLCGALFLAGWALGLPETLAVPFAFACLLLGLALGAERADHPLAGRWIHYLGEISYATYLAHFLLFFLFKLAFVQDAHAAAPARVALFLIALLPASAALYHCIERPAQRAILRAWAGHAHRFSPSLRSNGSAHR